MQNITDYLPGRITHLLYPFIFLSLVYSLYGQPTNFSGASPTNLCSEIGSPFIRNYEQKTYWGIKKYVQPQNWVIIQDQRRIMYFANQGGVLEYDGVCWKTLTEINFIARSLAIDSAGTLYVGGRNDLGILAQDSLGQFRFNSLLTHLPKKYHGFGNVWQTFAAGDGIYFNTTQFLIRWNGEQFKVWEARNGFHVSFSVNGKLFVRAVGVGLMTIINDSLRVIPDGEQFAQKRIYAMLPVADNILIGTRKQGFYLFDGADIKPFPTEVDLYLSKNMLYHGTVLNNGDFALATLLGGVIILEGNGKLKRLLDKSRGILDNNVKFVFQDRQGVLWLAMNNGISKAEISSPITILDKRAGLAGTILSITRHHGAIFIATTDGVYVSNMILNLNDDKSFNETFKRIPGVTGQCWSLLSINGSLLVATNSGVYQIREGVVNLISRGRTYYLHRSKIDTNCVYLGKGDGFAAMCFNKGQFQDKLQIPGISEDIRTIIETADGGLWLGSSQFVTRLQFSADFRQNTHFLKPNITRYDTAFGLPQGEIKIFQAGDENIFSSHRGIFRYNPNQDNFEPNPVFGEMFIDGTQHLFRLASDVQGNVWIHANSRNLAALRQADGSYLIKDTPLQRAPSAQVNAIYPDPEKEGIIWFGGTDGLIRFNSKIKKKYSTEFPVWIRKIIFNDDSTIYAGGNPKGYESKIPSIPYGSHSLRFECAAPSFENEKANLYRYYLEGFDNNWSSWTTQSWKDYTNLSIGKYQFRIQAKNVYDQLSSEDSYRFIVLPPWYRTWWAYVLYGVAFIAILILIIRKLVDNARKKALNQAEKEYLKREIDTAREMQLSLLPKASPQISGFDIKGFCLPAYDVGGDYFDFFWINNRKKELGITVVDVEGKRMQGALPSILVNGMIKTAFASESNENLPGIFKILNKLTKEILGGKISVTLVIGKLDIKEHCFTYVNAGCPSPLLKSNGTVDFIQLSSKDFRPALGIIEIVDSNDLEPFYKPLTVPLKKGDFIVIFSDGFSEAMNQDNERFVGRLKEIMQEIDSSTPVNELLDKIKIDLKNFTGDIQRQDDQTLVVIKKL